MDRSSEPQAHDESSQTSIFDGLEPVIQQKPAADAPKQQIFYSQLNTSARAIDKLRRPAVQGPDTDELDALIEELHFDFNENTVDHPSDVTIETPLSMPEEEPQELPPTPALADTVPASKTVITIPVRTIEATPHKHRTHVMLLLVLLLITSPLIVLTGTFVERKIAYDTNQDLMTASAEMNWNIANAQWRCNVLQYQTQHAGDTGSLTTNGKLTAQNAKEKACAKL